MYRKFANRDQVRRSPLRRAARATTGAGALAAALLVAAALPPAAASAAATGANPAWIHITANGSNVTCGIREGNTLWCWGDGAYGALGNGQTVNETVPQQISKPTAGWTGVSNGGGHGCATRNDGSLWCWGYNKQGELGLGTTASATRPHQVTSPASTGWTSVTAGPNQTCALRSDTTLWCWGYNGSGQLGIGGTTTQYLPQQVTTPASTGWTGVSAGYSYTCATRSDGTLWCWGYNLFGELGNGNTTNQDLPQQVTDPAGIGWTSAVAGGDHTCATRSDTTLWCWGKNLEGELGIGNTTNQDLPQQVTDPASTGWSSAASGGFHTCATRTHALWCWGENTSGQLGTGGTTGSDLPQRVVMPTGTGWSLIAAGSFHSCATHTGRTLWCWGNNNQGQLGIGSTTSQDLPQQVTG
jgi:alpha-tubulin suppressor-like RCC1 family protein